MPAVLILYFKHKNNSMVSCGRHMW